MGMWEGEYFELPEMELDESTTNLFDVDINKETEKAYSIVWNRQVFWVPKSQCNLFYGKSTITAKVKCWVLNKANIRY